MTTWCQRPSTSSPRASGAREAPQELQRASTLMPSYHRWPQPPHERTTWPPPLFQKLRKQLPPPMQCPPGQAISTLLQWPLCFQRAPPTTTATTVVTTAAMPPDTARAHHLEHVHITRRHPPRWPRERRHLLWPPRCLRRQPPQHRPQQPPSCHSPSTCPFLGHVPPSTV